MAAISTPFEHVNEVVRIADLVITSPTLTGHTFQNCLILGPAIVTILGGVKLTNSTLASGLPTGETFEAALWEIKAGEWRVGSIGLSDCTFNYCRFDGVGFAGTREFLDYIATQVME